MINFFGIASTSNSFTFKHCKLHVSLVFYCCVYFVTIFTFPCDKLQVLSYLVGELPCDMFVGKLPWDKFVGELPCDKLFGVLPCDKLFGDLPCDKLYKAL